MAYLGNLSLKYLCKGLLYELVSLRSPKRNLLNVYKDNGWWNKSMRSLIAHWFVSKLMPNSPNLRLNHELRGKVVNKGQIHGEIREFWDIFWNSIKSDNKWGDKLGKLIYLERELKDESKKSKINRIGSRFAEKSMSELERNFRTRRERNLKLKIK